ncbi:MAG TPA: hypothetical protein VGB13_11600 [Candidatus Krumholzibacteria bacterium]
MTYFVALEDTSDPQPMIGRVSRRLAEIYAEVVEQLLREGLRRYPGQALGIIEGSHDQWSTPRYFLIPLGPSERREEAEAAGGYAAREAGMPLTIYFPSHAASSG